MGNYQEPKEQKKEIWGCYTSEGIQDFAHSILQASEIEFIDIIKAKEESHIFNYPISFILINTSIDQVLSGLKATRPDMVPPMREYKKTIEDKKE